MGQVAVGYCAVDADHSADAVTTAIWADLCTAGPTTAAASRPIAQVYRQSFRRTVAAEGAQQQQHRAKRRQSAGAGKARQVRQGKAKQGKVWQGKERRRSKYADGGVSKQEADVMRPASTHLLAPPPDLPRLALPPVTAVPAHRLPRSHSSSTTGSTTDSTTDSENGSASDRGGSRHDQGDVRGEASSGPLCFICSRQQLLLCCVSVSLPLLWLCCASVSVLSL